MMKMERTWTWGHLDTARGVAIAINVKPVLAWPDDYFNSILVELLQGTDKPFCNQRKPRLSISVGLQ